MTLRRIRLAGTVRLEQSPQLTRKQPSSSMTSPSSTGSGGKGHPATSCPDADHSALREVLRGPGVLIETLACCRTERRHGSQFKNCFQRTTVPHARHSSHLKQPKTVADRVLGFLNS